MKRRMTPFVTLAMTLLCLAPTRAQNSFSLRGDWWQQPAQQTRHTTFVASFDSAENNDADYARDSAVASGYGMNANAAGLHGSGTAVAVTSGDLAFWGGSNLQGLHGALRVMVRGDIWADPAPRWLFQSRTFDPATDVRAHIGVKREPDKLSLVFTEIPRIYASSRDIARLDLPISDVATDGWHSVVASWDAASQTGWIALDGQGVSGPMNSSKVVASPFVFYVGSGAYGFEADGLTPPELEIDDFVLYDLPLPLLEAQPQPLAPEDAELLPVAEQAARRALHFLARQQAGGGWPWGYTWPGLIPIDGGYRENAVPADLYIVTDRGNTTTSVVQNFIYGYEVLGDHAYMDTVLRTADLLVAGQQPAGFWSFGYFDRPSGVEGVHADTSVKFKDDVQANPIFVLAQAYRLTEDERYLQALRRGGEFFLAVQNPNGSWPHHVDPRDGIGKTANGEPYGGELNDYATSHGIEIMALMYHLTGEAKYVNAMKRAGDWLIEAQGRDIPLWADGYDQDNNPVYERHFEPPAYGFAGSQYALESLLELYRFSGDERYVDAIRRTRDWAENSLADGKMAYYLEPSTGRPIAAWSDTGNWHTSNIYYLDNPDDVAYLHTVPVGGWVFQSFDILSTARSALQNAGAGTLPFPTEETVASARDEIRCWRERAQVSLATQNEAGVWIANTEAKLASAGPAVRSMCWELRPILRYIELCRTAMGELEPAWRGGGELRASAYPFADWYEVGWAQNAGQ